MKQRLATAAILIALIVPGFFFAPVRFLSVLMAAAFGVACVVELAGMFRPRGVKISRVVGCAAVLGLVAAAIFDRLHLAALIVGVSCCAAFACRMYRGELAGAWNDVAATVAAGVYVGLPIG